ncbi:hypothetical protein FRACYDRAFT_221097 [Fragilariopsis cylindrus CCMP1102]|uniref:Uncharacterized protein n=1 Tax=Fragilariopsis cylindrus CCMP1102 TaxID=635003 RepID=A0A1E7EPL7_9STRA|nr:hypothetical protein FRACYDRAFT_221097 [Fragilariopsis cylindrus CCMP1102]|eukprot:OEU07899.1 hypothetical protein FRACYDRAFT_221097 [Fragilariopsis cylindrus CCMP1102]
MVDCSAEYYDLSYSTEDYFNLFTYYCGTTTDAAAAAANISTESSTGTSSTIYVSRNNTKTTLVLFVAVTSALTYIVASIS